MLHQPGRFYTLIEVDKETTQSVFYFLKETKKNIFLEPDAEILSLYASAEKETIIIKSLVSEAPVQMLQGVVTTTIEKLLEKMIRALMLLEGLSKSGLTFIFKGGTALMLLLDSAKRLSIDIDWWKAILLS